MAKGVITRLEKKEIQVVKDIDKIRHGRISRQEWLDTYNNEEILSAFHKLKKIDDTSYLNHTNVVLRFATRDLEDAKVEGNVRYYKDWLLNTLMYDCAYEVKKIETKFWHGGYNIRL